MNIGPQPNGELPAVALDRLKSLGEWTSVYGETIYGTDAGDISHRSGVLALRRMASCTCTSLL